jgi:hypothetical protein
MAPNDSGGTIVKEKSSKVIAVILKTIVTSEGGWLRQLGFANFFLEESYYQFELLKITICDLYLKRKNLLDGFKNFDYLFHAPLNFKILEEE